MTPTPEHSIISFILSYNNYNRYIKYIALNKELKELNILYNTLAVLHEKFPGTDKTLEELEFAVHANYPRLSNAEKGAISDLINALREVKLSPEVAEQMLGLIRQRSTARDAALAFLDVSEGRRSIDEALVVVASFGDASDSFPTKIERKYVTADLNALRSKTFDGGGLYWPLRSLNHSLGPLRVGDFGFIFGRPETGKTTLLSHIVTHMAMQAKRPIVWFNNEEQGEKVRVRTFQAALGQTTNQLWKDIRRNQDQYDRITNGLITIVDDDEGATNRRDVELIIEELKPELVIFDQIDKINGFEADRNDLVYGKIYRWARGLAKKYCPIIGTCQADGTGEGVKWLTMSHVADAKTAKQAEADWILGIGRSNEGGTEDVRFFNISKNKLLGDKDTDPELRHGRFDVWIYPQIARYGDILT